MNSTVAVQRTIWLSLVLLSLCLYAIQTNAAETKPNIIFVISDDLSWGDLGCYGQKKIKTPNIDRIATEGMKFTSCYAGNAVCAPSRSGLMQGLHPGHARVRGNFVGHYRHSLTKDDLTVPMLLKQAGYATGLFGKWGIGMLGTDGFPTKKGFDEFVGFANQHHGKSLYPDHYWRNDMRVSIPENKGFRPPYNRPAKYTADGTPIPPGIANPDKAVYQTDLFHREALKFIRSKANKDKPFFLYYASALPHGPLIVPDLAPYTNKDWPSIRHKEWAAMITRLDTEVGRILDLLEELKIDDDTLVFFVSDNGQSSGGYSGYNRGGTGLSIEEFFKNASPVRGTKGNLYAGGVLVPALARWPGKIAPGSVSDQPWAFWDFMPTAAELAGAATPKNIDGISIVPTLLGQSAKQQQHDYFYWEYGGSRAARFGDYWAHQAKGKRIELFDLTRDPQQRNNLAGKQPELVAKANRIFKKVHVPSEVWPSPGESNSDFKARMTKLGNTHWPNNYSK